MCDKSLDLKWEFASTVFRFTGKENVSGLTKEENNTVLLLTGAPCSFGQFLFILFTRRTKKIHSE